jgi:DNA repair ATPase RecN
MKPISEWTDAELREPFDYPSHSEMAALAAEVMRLRQLDEVTIRHWREQMARAERAEAELASWTTVACQQTDTIDELTSQVTDLQHNHDVMEMRALQAEAEVERLTHLQVRHNGEIETYCRYAREAQAELERCQAYAEEGHANARLAEAELARQKPVIDAAVAWKNANRDGFYGRGRMSDDLIEAVRALLRDGGGTDD